MFQTISFFNFLCFQLSLHTKHTTLNKMMVVCASRANRNQGTSLNNTRSTSNVHTIFTRHKAFVFEEKFEVFPEASVAREEEKARRGTRQVWRLRYLSYCFNVSIS